MKNKIKNEGQIFTPAYLVKDMLDFADYRGYDILNKHVMENGCGDGAFLAEIVRRYCGVFQRESLKSELETFIHGIEKDQVEHRKCISRMDAIAKEFGITDVKWDIICGDSLELSKNYYKKMDFVIGNPPYVRVHNIGEKYHALKRFSFVSDGMIDEYLAFFEIGLNMLSQTGKLCLITPSSFLRSKAGQNFRNYIFKHRTLSAVCDLAHFQPFNATTYTIISLFDNNRKQPNKFSYWLYKSPNNMEFIDNIKFDDAFINGKMYLSDKDSLQELRNIELYGNGGISVKNGFATLADDVFINEFDFDEMCIPVIKSSTGKWKKCIFPYKKNGDPLPEFAAMAGGPAWKHLLKNREILENRSIENKNEWYLFGRTQALRDVSKNKIAINQLIKDKNSLKVSNVPAGSGVYGGLYIISNFKIKEMEQALKSDDFMNYVKSLRNYKSGGYYTYSSSDLEKFLNYYLNERKENELELVANN